VGQALRIHQGLKFCAKSISWQEGAARILQRRISTGSRASFDHLDAGPLSSGGDFETEHVRDLRLVTNSNVVGRITRTSAGFLEIARRRSRSGMAQIDRSGHEPFTRSARWRLRKMQRHVDTERLGGHRRDQGRSRVVAKCGETGIGSVSYFVSN
jgi:hypothetical protein